MEREVFLTQLAETLAALIAQCTAKRQPSDALVEASLQIVKELGKQGDYETLVADVEKFKSSLFAVMDDFRRTTEDSNNKFRTELLAEVNAMRMEYQTLKGRVGIKSIAQQPNPRST